MLFAQTASPATTPVWLFVAPAVGIVGLLAFAALLLLLLRYFSAGRQLRHVERMRSIEAGFPVEAVDSSQTQAKFMHNAFWISFWLGFGVPAVAFNSASSAEKVIAGSLALGIAVWVSAAAASVAGVIGAIILMIYSMTRTGEKGVAFPQKPLKSM